MRMHTVACAITQPVHHGDLGELVEATRVEITLIGNSLLEFHTGSHSPNI